MELMHYSHNDDVTSIAKKNNVNLRRLSVQIDQRINPLTSAMGDLQGNVDSDIDALNQTIDGIQQRIDRIKIEPPVGAYIILDQNTNPIDIYPNTTWLSVDTITMDSNNKVNVYQRTD